MTIRNLNRALSTATLSLLLAACASNDLSENTGHQPRLPSATLAASLLPVNAAQAILISSAGDTTQKFWLSTGADNGIQLQDSHFTLLDKKDIQAEFIDQRRDQQGTLFVSIDKENNRPVSYRINNQRITDLAFGQALTYPVEGICLYQPAGSPLQLFVLDEQQMAHQLLIKSDGKVLIQQEIRRFPLPPNSEYCVADDVSGQLFVSEEIIGRKDCLCAQTFVGKINKPPCKFRHFGVFLMDHGGLILNLSFVIWLSQVLVLCVTLQRFEPQFGNAVDLFDRLVEFGFRVVFYTPFKRIENVGAMEPLDRKDERKTELMFIELIKLGKACKFVGCALIKPGTLLFALRRRGQIGQRKLAGQIGMGAQK